MENATFKSAEVTPGVGVKLKLVRLRKCIFKFADGTAFKYRESS